MAVEKIISNGKKTILIAEDDVNNFFFMGILLSKSGLDIIHASNGEEAVEICKSGKHIDLILMDIQMPIMDGYEAIEIIKKIKPDLPVIIQTAYTFESVEEKILSLGCDDYISKPIKREVLLELLKKYL